MGRDTQYFWKGSGTLHGVAWHFIGGPDNHLETMLYNLILISLCGAIYTFPIT